MAGVNKIRKLHLLASEVGQQDYLTIVMFVQWFWYYAFLKTAKEVREFLSKTFDKATKDPVTLSDEIGNFRFYLCSNYGEEAKEKAEFFLENIAVPKFWKYFSDENKSKATLSILNNNIIKYIRNAETDENGYIEKLKWTRKKAAIDYKTAYVYHRFNSQFKFETAN